MTHKPNILFIMTDQQRYDCIGVNGNDTIKTPNLDKLAMEAAKFHSCFVQAPVCVPSRQTFFTGRYPHSHKNRVNFTPLDKKETLMQAYLKQNGYNTACVGKLHYYPSTKEHAISTGFDEVELHDGPVCDKHSDYVKWLSNCAPEYVENYSKTTQLKGKNPFTTVIPDEFHQTTWCGLKTREKLKQLAQSDKPFFLFSSYWKPHAPFEVPEPWASMYDECEISLPQRVGREYIETLPLPVQELAMRSKKSAFDKTDEKLLWEYKAYYGAVSQLDREIGLTLDLVSELGIKENTIVVFCSDHGDLLLEHGINGKNVFYESAIHIPLMIRYPQAVLPNDFEDLVEATDILPSLFQLCEIDVPYHCQGRSFFWLVTGKRFESEYLQRQYVFCENIIPEVNTRKMDYPYIKGKGVGGILHPDAKMVRSKEWKYNYYPGHGEELFNILEDPCEMNNLVTKKEYTGQLNVLKNALLDWLITSEETEQIASRWCDDV